MALAVTFEPRTRRLAPTVPPLPYSTHWPPASRYETAKFLMCWPFWMASSKETTLKVRSSGNSMRSDWVPVASLALQ